MAVPFSSATTGMGPILQASLPRSVRRSTTALSTSSVSTRTLARDFHQLAKTFPRNRRGYASGPDQKDEKDSKRVYDPPDGLSLLRKILGFIPSGLKTTPPPPTTSSNTTSSGSFKPDQPSTPAPTNWPESDPTPTSASPSPSTPGSKALKPPSRPFIPLPKTASVEIKTSRGKTQKEADARAAALRLEKKIQKAAESLFAELDVVENVDSKTAEVEKAEEKLGRRGKRALAAKKKEEAAAPGSKKKLTRRERKEQLKQELLEAKREKHQAWLKRKRLEEALEKAMASYGLKKEFKEPLDPQTEAILEAAQQAKADKVAAKMLEKQAAQEGAQPAQEGAEAGQPTENRKARRLREGKSKGKEEFLAEAEAEDADSLEIPDSLVEEALKQNRPTAENSSGGSGPSRRGRGPAFDVEMTALRSGQLSGKGIKIEKVEPIRHAAVAKLGRGLDRVLFNPAVQFLRDPRSHVYNFSPTLESIPRPEEFAFDRLPKYITASADPELLELANTHQLKFYGSTSTLTAALSQIYFLISGSRPVDVSHLSSVFSHERTDFTAGARLPAKLSIKIQPDGRYAVDNDKGDEADETILSDLGRVMEKLLTSDVDDMSRYLKSSPESAVSEEERNEREAYFYSKGSSLLMRSQLDCHDSRLPGNGTFDIKTRAAIVIRHDRANHEESSAYDIGSIVGLYESFERELYDMSRSAFLKYSLQVRIGNMDGIFVAYHNTRRIFGFQYISLAEMSRILHGTEEMGEQAFKLSVSLLESILEEATSCFPGQSISLIIENSDSDAQLTAFVQPENTRFRVEGVDGVPNVALTVKTKARLNDKEVAGWVSFEDLNSATPAGIDWNLDFEISKTPFTAEGLALARNGRKLAIKRHTNLGSLNLPTGKTVQDMVDAAAEKAASQGLAEGEGARTKWREPDGRIKSLRNLALESGRRYEERIEKVKGKQAVVWTPQ